MKELITKLKEAAEKAKVYEDWRILRKNGEPEHVYICSCDSFGNHGVPKCCSGACPACKWWRENPEPEGGHHDLWNFQRTLCSPTNILKLVAEYERMEKDFGSGSV